MTNFLGQHWLIEGYHCNTELVSDPVVMEKILHRAAEIMGATIVTSTFHHFSPLGVSGVVVIQESHLTIHTWPEYAYAAIDIFTCGEIDMQAGVEYLQKALEADELKIVKMKRGNLDKNLKQKG